MNPFMITFCCLAVAITSGGVLNYIPSGTIGISADGALVAGPAGSIHTNNGLHGYGAAVQISGPSGDLHTQTWDHGAEEDIKEHADDGEKQEDWILEEEEEHKEDDKWKKWDDEEKKWDENEGQWGEEVNGEHKLVRRDLPRRKISNGPEGRWNKEEERYIWNDESKNNEGNNYQDDLVGPYGIPAWNHGF